jgi:hypothetical protein
MAADELISPSRVYPITAQLNERTTILNTAAVLVANQLNLSIFKPFWMAKMGILREDEFTDGTLVSPAVIAIPTESFELTILPNRVQMRFSPHALNSAQTELSRIAGGIAVALPHTPFTAVGLNFEYFISTPPSTDFATWNRHCFAAPCLSDLPVIREETARFGSYFSYDILESRLKIDLKPVKQESFPTLPPQPSGSEGIHVAFNYHIDLVQPSSTDEIIAILARWDASFNHSVEVIEYLEK